MTSTPFRKAGAAIILAVRTQIKLKHFLKHLILAFFLAFSGNTAVNAADHAVILMYHRFGESRLPSTNIRLAQFEKHLEILAGEAYTVWPLSKIISYMQDKKTLPDRTVAITIDDAYISVYKEAWPRLKKRNFPFTVFVATNPIDNGLRGYMNWDQLRQLQADGVEIGSQTASHPHMHEITLDASIEEIKKSNNRFLTELGMRPNLFAYPYGEYNLSVISQVKAAGFIAAFGQNSGIAHGYDGFFELPRFAMNEQYGTENRLMLAINGLPLKVNQVLPEDVVIDKNPPAFGFTLAPELSDSKRLNCFNNTYEKLEINRFEQRIEVRFPGPLPSGRARVNCTMPAESGRWRWFGKQFLIP